ncbi:histone-lysine N-methyltransferase 2D-like [Lingula anatina]|uniref:Histone-lysine N-methyltransferase 2D-like n=1 Tax=Lingula anatina TaxID=7574 RepID=A0A2R2MIV2_LINAN|nr:histone-lysine N-methyltransferase 2D-like [Lingula anatina]|eukprot:XP_023929977.1 histone-lysine N-methyltransferase 2D-like [Lingula anatina]
MTPPKMLGLDSAQMDITVLEMKTTPPQILGLDNENDVTSASSQSNTTSTSTVPTSDQHVSPGPHEAAPSSTTNSATAVDSQSATGVSDTAIPVAVGAEPMPGSNVPIPAAPVSMPQATVSMPCVPEVSQIGHSPMSASSQGAQLTTPSGAPVNTEAQHAIQATIASTVSAPVSMETTISPAVQTTASTTEHVAQPVVTNMPPSVQPVVPSMGQVEHPGGSEVKVEPQGSTAVGEQGVAPGQVSEEPGQIEQKVASGTEIQKYIKTEADLTVPQTCQEETKPPPVLAVATTPHSAVPNTTHPPMPSAVAISGSAGTKPTTNDMMSSPAGMMPTTPGMMPASNTSMSMATGMMPSSGAGPTSVGMPTSAAQGMHMVTAHQQYGMPHSSMPHTSMPHTTARASTPQSAASQPPTVQSMPGMPPLSMMQGMPRPGMPVATSGMGATPHPGMGPGMHFPPGMRPRMMPPGMHHQPGPPFPPHPGQSRMPGSGMVPPTPGMVPPTSGMVPPGQQPQFSPQMPGGMGAPRKDKPVLLEEQPLLLQELLEQERRDQQKQAEQQVLIQKRDSGLMSDAEFEKRRAELAITESRRPPMPGPRMPGMGMEGMPRPGDQWQGPMGGPREGMFPPPYPGRPQGPHMMPRTPSPFGSSPAEGGMGPRPPPPQGTDPLSEAERREQYKYEEWLMQHAHLLSMQVKYLEQQIAKQRKTKKSIQNKQKQARKAGAELKPEEQQDLDKANQEITLVQKQLDQVRKQQRQHQTLIQEYRQKQQERYGVNWPAPTPPTKPGQNPMGAQQPPMMQQPNPMMQLGPGHMMQGQGHPRPMVPGSPQMQQPPTTMMPQPPSSMMPQSTTGMMPQSGAGMLPQPPGGMMPQSPSGMMPQQPPPGGMMPQPPPNIPQGQHVPVSSSAAGPGMSVAPPRMPGQGHSARLTAAQRQEYDQYMQQRLGLLNQPPTPTQPSSAPAPSTAAASQPLPAAPAAGTTVVPSVRGMQGHHGDENNPFSDTYMQREHLVKMQERHKHLEQQKQRILQEMEKHGALTPEERQKFIQQMQMFTQQVGIPDPGQGQGQGHGFPGPRMPQEGMPRFPGDPSQGMRPRFPGDSGFPGPRMPGDPGGQFRPPMSADQQQFRSPLDSPHGQVRSPFSGQLSPSTSMPLPPHFPPSDNFPQFPGTEEKTKKKRKRKKKDPEESQPPPPPVPDVTQQSIEQILASIPKLPTPPPAGSMGPVGGPPQRTQMLAIPGPICTPSVFSMMQKKPQATAAPSGEQEGEKTEDADAEIRPELLELREPAREEGSASTPDTISGSGPSTPMGRTSLDDTLDAVASGHFDEKMYERKETYRPPSAASQDSSGYGQGQGGQGQGGQGQGHMVWPSSSLDNTLDSTLDAVAAGQFDQTQYERKEVFIGESVSLQDESDDPDSSATQNLLLKQLLATTPRANLPPGALARRMSEISGLFMQDDMDMVNLTPEQRRQLEEIDNMPLMLEREISQEEWDCLPEEEKFRIKELQRQMQKSKELLSPASKLKKMKGKKSPKEGSSSSGKDGPPKKRSRKPKPTEDYEQYIQGIIQHLRTMPAVHLQEPEVAVNHSLCPAYGSGEVMTGENQLRGTFGSSQAGDFPDYYGHYPFTNVHPLPLAPSGGHISRFMTEIAQRRQMMGEIAKQNQRAGDQQQQQRYRLLPGTSGAAGEGGAAGAEEGATKEPEAIARLISRAGSITTFAPSPVPSPPIIGPRLDIPSRLSNTPSSIVSSSSPENLEEDVKYPALRVIDPVDNTQEDNRTSPAIPLIKPTPVRATQMKVEKEEMEAEVKMEKMESGPASQALAQIIKDKENMELMADKQSMANEKSESLSSVLGKSFADSVEKQVSVTLTLSAAAAEDMSGVIARLANLLKIAVPPSYEISRSPSPDLFRTGRKHREEAINIQTLIKAKQKYCRHCDVLVPRSGIQKKVSEMPFLSKEEQESLDEDDVMFCSMNCYMQFALSHRTSAGTAESKEASDVVEYKSSSAVQDDAKLPPPSIPASLSVSLTESGTGVVIKKDVKALKHRRSSSSLDGVPATPKPLEKKWRGKCYKHWEPKMVPKAQAYTPPSDEELTKLIRKIALALVPNPVPEDTRKCAFCHEKGEGETDGPGRLLNLDTDKWSHLNCALWSHEVYETCAGALINVDASLKRGMTLECVLCKRSGATLGCFKVRCTNIYHVGCAQKDGCVFFQDKTILCPVHKPKGVIEGELKDLTVFRRVYIQREESKQVASFSRIVHRQDTQHAVRIGSLILHSVGQLLPHQIASGKFHTRDTIYPVGFRITRFYWSMHHLKKRCKYMCSISDKDGHPEFEVKVMEEGMPEVAFKEATPKEAWMHLLTPMEKMRRDADLVKMFPAYMDGEDLFGLHEPIIVQLIESLPGTDLLHNYSFKFGRSPLIEMPLAINPTGCARSEPKLRTHFRRPHTLHSSKTHSLPSTVTGVTSEVDSPYFKQFVHSKSQQYRRMKTEWRSLVYLARSRIQGLGLYAARDTEKHTMVIEYIGELIRNETAEMREKIYEASNRGIYMFRINDDTVVDATMSGGLARYVNHSCNPNCVAEVVPFEKESKIIIIAKRRIATGEELTYDYKFDFEDEQHKIPCCCGAPNCRKWMN